MRNAPKKITFKRETQQLEIVFEAHTFSFSPEFLRVYSPSAEVKGHGSGQEVLQLNKQNVTITNIDPQGNYAIRLVFDDGHDSGIYTWDYLFDLGLNKESLWQEYLSKVEEKNTSAITWVDPQ